ncbi:response regulator [uncultured Desulfuromusa sp.]|uniref:phosphorylase family protein n=1 Tax=uncultured Desulfuromusa sp. TaxID=219183 RepID=UPI002AA7ED3D|nr:response regulator [uncultured Desulfuromusa sp.]
MKVLIVDDQYEKVKVFARCLSEASIKDITHVTSSFQALESCSQHQYDLMILDIQLPERLGDEINKRGGVNLLERLEIDDKCFTPVHVVAATSYDDSYDEFKEYFDRKPWKILRDINDEEIINEIIHALSKHSINTENYDVALLTALPHIEQEAVFNLPLNWKEKIEFDDTNKYYVAEFENSEGQKKSIITTCCPRMGIASSAAVAMKMLLKFKPKLFLMTGIAAGIKGKCDIGDILIADPCWDWGSGKMTVVDGKAKFMSAPHQIPLNTRLRAQLKEMSVARTYLHEIHHNWDAEKGKQPEAEPNLLVGPIASGAVVIEDPDTLKLIISQNRETVGVEMEAYGLLAATIYSNGKNKTEALIIKSVCDFADIEKNNEWQEYAAYTSTEFAYRLLIDCIV